MNYIQKLLQRQKVEWKNLSEVAEVGTGSSNRQDEDENGIYPFYVRSKNVLRSNTFQFNETAIIVPGEGGIGDIFHFAQGKYALHQRAYRISVQDERLDPKFLFYVMNNSFKSYILSKSVGATATSIRKPMLQNFKIPLPPLAVQQEIANILDTFTTLEAELEAELEARKKQYEYYRNNLLSFNEIGGGNLLKISNLQWKTLGEIGYFYGGLTGKNKNDFSDGNAKYITYMNVFKNLAVDFDIDDWVKVNQGEKQNKVQYGDVLFTGSSENPDECGMSSVVNQEINEDVYLNSFCFGFRLNEPQLFEPDFLKHLFRGKELRKQIGKTANGVTRFNVSKKLMAKIKIPIPPIEEQKRIVNILDKFDTLTNSITEGLPKEIELRRKQYEYYREKLLMFND